MNIRGKSKKISQQDDLLERADTKSERLGPDPKLAEIRGKQAPIDGNLWKSPGAPSSGSGIGRSLAQRPLTGTRSFNSSNQLRTTMTWSAVVSSLFWMMMNLLPSGVMSKFGW